ncbi:T9SS type A sorting domain-containing protein [Pseudoflavitalea rhizosphaerae]|uniref:T9SS type A sorting domain-containing protein n=1 Tax=Pseudoflavitalea rhizosphaerae TaxID=1884793 RepID=UPI0013E04915|nr:T9SS type A sorting domain-containing protein [Pseudoflavitalea rhizosphaerae]
MLTKKAQSTKQFLNKINPTLLLLFLIFYTSTLQAQNCTINAGGNAIVCGSTTTLTGTESGTTGAGTPVWTFVSGPVVPTIATPNSLVTNITGMTMDGNYVFQLSRACGTGTAISTVTITAHPRPASFTAGPEITNVCATVGTTPLAGVIPAGFTGAWRSVNIYSWSRYSTVVNTNSSFDNTTTATPVFSLINKANHTIDPSYYAILRITSADNTCSYEDTTIVRFVPNPVLVYTGTTSLCRDAGNDRTVIFPAAGSPIVATNYPNTSGAASSGTAISINVVSQPAGANLTFDRISDEGRLFLAGGTIPGTYQIQLTVTNSCGTHTTPTLTYNFTGVKPHFVNFQPAGHEAPEQLTIYSNAGSGGEVHCSSKAGTTTPETFYFSIDPADPATVVTTVTNRGITPPGGAPTIALSGAGTYDRMVTVTPPAGGWSVGTYSFSVSTSNGACEVNQSYFIHITDNGRTNVGVPDVSACYTAAGAVISATVPLPAVYKGVVNSSYLQEFGGYYNFAVVSKPAGSANPTYTSTSLRSLTSTSTTISNLNMPGDYVFSITAMNGPGAGPIMAAEYGCSGASLSGNFTIHVEEKINPNAGSDLTSCTQSVPLLGNSAGAGTGLWTFIDGPAGASPTIASPGSPSTTASNLDFIGQYRFAWNITTPLGGCTGQDIVTYDITCALPVSLTEFTATRQSAAVVLNWSTASESNNRGFSIEHSTDGSTWTSIGFQPSKAEGGNSSGTIAYSYKHNSPANSTNFYRLKQIDFDGKWEYSPVRQIRVNGQSILVYPNPAKDIITIQGLAGNETIQVFDATGRKVKQLSGMPQQQKISIADLREGTYHIIVVTREGNMSSHKITKLK